MPQTYQYFWIIKNILYLWCMETNKYRDNGTGNTIVEAIEFRTFDIACTGGEGVND
jgi:hypothetical protein